MKKIIMALVVLSAVVTLVTTSCQPKKPVQLTVEVFDRGSDGGRSLAYDNSWTNWIKQKVKEELNIDITFIPVGRWSEDTDIVNLMASGTAPDLCYSYNAGMIGGFRDQGGILDLSPYVEQYLPDMKKLLGADPALPGKDLIYRQKDPVTGKMFSIQSYVVNNAQRNIFIRKDWLDKLGLPVPKTTQEFYRTLITFRERADELPGSGGRNRVIPYGQDSDARWGFAQIVYAFFDPKINERDLWITNFSDRPITVPGFKDGLRMINQWYNEDLVYKDFPLLRVADDYFNLLKTGRIGAYSGNWDHPYRQDLKIQEELSQNIPGAEFISIDCIQSPDGITRKFVSDKVGLHIFIPASSKNAVAALRYLNWLCKQENLKFLQTGHLGINHIMENGVPKVIATEPGHQWMQNSANNIDYTLPINGIEMFDPELNAKVLALSYGNSAKYIAEAYANSVRNGRAPPVYQAVTTLDGKYGQTLRDKADVLITQAVTARTQDFDRVWDSGMRDYLASGAQEIMDERAGLWK